MLHLAAMPFPTPQGTQALIAQMLKALHADGRATTLLSYGDVPPQRQRSGPSWYKAAQDQRLWRALRLQRMPSAASPGTDIVAHHVEAALMTLAVGERPRLFVAHTSLRDELPSYFANAWRRPLANAGRRLDRFLCRRSVAVAAVAPALCQRLEQQTGTPVHYLVPPWSVPPERSQGERRDARQTLGFDATQPVLLYAGNLDAYQGCEMLIAALARLRQQHPAAQLLIATASATSNDTAALRRLAQTAGVADAIGFAPLRSEAQRRRAYAAADLALVPRRHPGGVSVKLLDALCRGVPTIATRRAVAGLPIDHCSAVVADDDAAAMTAAATLLLASPQRHDELSRASRHYVATQHGAASFLRSYDAALEHSPLQLISDRAGVSAKFKAQ